MTVHSPALGTLLPRATFKYGSPHILGTVSGLTRIGMSIGQSVGPILGATLYSLDNKFLALHFGTTGVLFIALGCYALLLVKTRPEFVVPLEGTEGADRATNSKFVKKEEEADAAGDTFESELKSNPTFGANTTAGNGKMLSDTDRPRSEDNGGDSPQNAADN